MLRYTYLDEFDVNDSEIAYLPRSSVSTCFAQIQIIPGSSQLKAPNSMDV